MLDWEHNSFLLRQERIVVQASHLSLSIDCSHEDGVEEHGPTHINQHSDRGTKITSERLSVFVEAMDGTFERTGASPRADLIEYTSHLGQFCKLTSHPDPYSKSVGRAKRYWRGTCHQHQEYGYCCHSVFWAHQDEVSSFEPSGVGIQRVPKRSAGRSAGTSCGKRKASVHCNPARTDRRSAPATTAPAHPSGIGVLLSDHLGTAYSSGLGGSVPLPTGLLVQYYVRGNDTIVKPTLAGSPTLYLSEPKQYRDLTPDEKEKYDGIVRANRSVGYAKDLDGTEGLSEMTTMKGRVGNLDDDDVGEAFL